MACGNLLEIFLERYCFQGLQRVRFFGNSGYSWGIPPPPIPLKSLLGAGFAKNVYKILIADGLRVKILSANDLRVELLSLALLPPL
jgi:hypothetical protein